MNTETLQTDEGGQVRGLGNAAVQTILGEFGIAKMLAEEDGRTSLGSLGLMKTYVDAIKHVSKKFKILILNN